MHEQFGDLDRVVERVGADDADVAGDRVEGFDAAGERAGMGQRGVASRLRLSELDRDDDFPAARAMRQAALNFARLAIAST